MASLHDDEITTAHGAEAKERWSEAGPDQDDQDADADDADADADDADAG